MARSRISRMARVEFSENLIARALGGTKAEFASSCYREFITAVNLALSRSITGTTIVDLHLFYVTYVQYLHTRNIYNASADHLLVCGYLGSAWDRNDSLHLDCYLVPVRGIVACLCDQCAVVKPQIVGKPAFFTSTYVTGLPIRAPPILIPARRPLGRTFARALPVVSVERLSGLIAGALHKHRSNTPPPPPPPSPALTTSAQLLLDDAVKETSPPPTKVRRSFRRAPPST